MLYDAAELEGSQKNRFDVFNAIYQVVCMNTVYISQAAKHLTLRVTLGIGQSST